VEKEEAKAARLYGQAADQGHAVAQCYLVHCYHKGKGVGADKAQAARLYGQAAEQDHASAWLWLGWCYEHGQGKGQNAGAAVEQYGLALQDGDPAADASLGLCFEKGRGALRSDPAEAARLYVLAVEGGTAGEEAFDEAMAVLPDECLTPDALSAAFLARAR
jgi:TPR repeat protein